MEKKKIDMSNFTEKVNRSGETLRKWVTPKRLSIFLTIVYIVSLIPVLWIGYYNYPSADDYSNGSSCRQVFVKTGSVMAAIGRAVKKAAEEWISWRGCFTSSFLSALAPNVFDVELYRITVWLVIVMFSLACIYLLHCIFVKAFRTDKWTSLCVSMLLLLASVQCMVGRTEIFYWYSGAINYLFTYGMCLFFYGLLISAYNSSGKSRMRELILASLLGFLIGGGNQVTMLNAAIVLFAAIVLMAYFGKWKKQRGLFVPMLLFYIGFILNVCAPGNQVRASSVSGMSPVKAILVSFYYCLDCAIDQWTTWPVLLMIALMAPLFWHMAVKTTFQFRCPVIVVLFGYCLVSATATPPLFSIGNLEAGRLQAMVFVVYILLLTLCTGYAIGWVEKKFEVFKERKNGTTEVRAQNDRSFSVNEVWYILFCIMFLAFATVITVIPDPHYFTFSSALTDLANGSAKAYGNALKEREKIYQSGEKDVVVQPLPVQPALLYFSDIKEDPGAWENKGLCRFYGIDSVRVEAK